MTLNQKLKYLRSMEKLPQNLIAEILRVDRSTYAYYESGKTLPDIYKLYAIARLYDLPMEFFVNENWEMDGAEAFIQAGKEFHGHYNSENSLYVRKHLSFYKRMARYNKR